MILGDKLLISEVVLSHFVSLSIASSDIDHPPSPVERTTSSRSTVGGGKRLRVHDEVSYGRGGVRCRERSWCGGK
jgi:hypothetical protein